MRLTQANNAPGALFPRDSTVIIPAAIINRLTVPEDGWIHSLTSFGFTVLSAVFLQLKGFLIVFSSSRHRDGELPSFPLAGPHG